MTKSSSSSSLIRWLFRSRSSSSSNILPALGAHAMSDLQYCHTLKKYVISPNDPKYRRWKLWLVVLVVYSAWASPFELAFRKAASTGCLKYVDLTVDAFFAVDIVLTFFVAYLDKSTYLLVTDHNKIAIRYIRKLWFPMDVASTLPFELIHMVHMNHTYTVDEVFGYLNLLRLWRLKHVSNLFKRLEKDTRVSYFWIRTFKVVCVTFFTVHAAGCVYYWLAVHHKNKEDTWIGNFYPDFKEKGIWTGYAYSMYFSVTTFTSVGYGDFLPISMPEKLFTMFYMLSNMALTAYVIGHMTVLIVDSITTTFTMRNSIKKIVEFGSKNRVPEELKEQMIANMQLKFRTEEIKQEHVLKQLPKAIKSSISQHLFRGTVASTYLFKQVSNELIDQLVTVMEAEYFPPKVEIILQNEMPTDFYFIVLGTMEMLRYKDGIEQVVGKLECGGIAGEVGVLFNIPQPFIVRTNSLSQVIRISHTHFNQITQQHNADRSTIMSNLVQYLKGLNNEMREEMPFLTMLLGDLNKEHAPSNEELQDCIRFDHLGEMKTKGSIVGRVPIRVIIHGYPPDENGKTRGKLILVPNSIEDLFRISEEKFGRKGTTILMGDGSEVDELNVLRDNDNLFIT